MNWNDWYTDQMDVFRVMQHTENHLTRNVREQVMKAVPCRIYRKDGKTPTMSQTAASVEQTSYLACALGAELHAGDELLIHRGARLGYHLKDVRAFAGEPNPYVEPFGAVMPGLAHQEVALLEQEYVT